MIVLLPSGSTLLSGAAKARAVVGDLATTGFIGWINTIATLKSSEVSHVLSFVWCVRAELCRHISEALAPFVIRHTAIC